jgi:hypothetical protein
MTMKKLLLALFLLLPAGAFAQEAKVVASCGTVPLALPAGSTQYATVDVNGNTCIAGTTTITPSGEQNVNLNQYNSAAVPANGLPTQLLGTAAIVTGQASVTTGNISIVAARTGAAGTGRKSVCVVNVTGTGPVYIGATGVSTSTGQYLGATAGSSLCLDTQAALFGTVTSVTQTVSYTETY